MDRAGFRGLQDHRLAGAVIVAGALLAVAFWAVLSADSVRLVMQEDGLIETASAALHFMVAGGLLVAAVLFRRPFLPLLAVLATLLGMREFDGHNTITSDSVTRISFYLDPGISLAERLGVAAFFAVLVGVIAIFAWRHASSFRASLRAREAAAWSFAAGVAMLPVLKAIDSLPRWLRGIDGVSLGDSALALLLSVEEVMELALPVVFLTAVLQFTAARQRG